MEVIQVTNAISVLLKEKHYAQALRKSLEMARTMNPAQIALSTQKPSLSTITRKQGELVAVGLIMNMINDLCDSYNVGKNMNAEQILDCAQLILQDFNDWKLPNVQQCFDRAKAGRYGRVFDRIDTQVVIEFCSAYDIERMEDIALANEKKSGEMKGLVREPLKALELMKKEQIKDYVPKRDADSMQLFFNVKYELWERLCAKQPQNPGFRFLKRYGKMLSGSDYVEYKLQQKNRIEKLRNK